MGFNSAFKALKGEYLHILQLHINITIALLVVAVAYLRHDSILITTTAVNSIATTFVFNWKKNYTTFVATISIAVSNTCPVIIATALLVLQLWTA
jgi:Ni/Fe-hydrogenase subunit HybB-like protein